MKERPILFSGEMIRAILDGRKTQTRRVIKPQPAESMRYSGAKSVLENDYDFPENSWMWWYLAPAISCEMNGLTCYGWPDDKKGVFKCPYGVPGDRLWVKEGIYYNAEHSNFYYSADNKGCGSEIHRKFMETKNPYSRKKLSPIFMFRWASRLNLEVTGVRVERVQKITEEDAAAEGIGSIARSLRSHGRMDGYGLKGTDAGDAFKTRITAFESLWNSINTKRGFTWESNPWVWVVAFKKLED